MDTESVPQTLRSGQRHSSRSCWHNLGLNWQWTQRAPSRHSGLGGLHSGRSHRPSQAQIVNGHNTAEQGQGILTLACSRTLAKRPHHVMWLGCMEHCQMHQPENAINAAWLGAITISLWWRNMAQPCVTVTWVRQGDAHTGLGLPSPGSKEKTWAHPVPCSTSQKATIRVSRSIVQCFMGERENGSGPVDRSKSQEMREEGRELRCWGSWPLDQLQHTGKWDLYFVWAAQQRSHC